MTRATHKQKYLPFTGFRKWKLAGYPVRKFPRKAYQPMKHNENEPHDTIIIPPDVVYGLIVVLLTVAVFATALIVMLSMVR